MSSLYELRLNDNQGRLLDSYNNINALAVAKGVNNFGTLITNLPTKRVKDLKPDHQIELWKSVNGAAPFLLFNTTWLVRPFERVIDGSGDNLQFKAFDATQLLDRRCVAYASGSSQAQKLNMAADNMMKEIVTENLGSGAIAARSWNSYLSVQANLTQGPLTNKSIAWRQSVLEVLQEIAQDSVTKGKWLFFDIVKGSTKMFEFKTWVNQRGQDRTKTSGNNPVIFGPQYGNLTDIKITLDYGSEFTYIYVLGQGRETNRTVIERPTTVTPAITKSIFGRIETTWDGRNTEDQNILIAEAESRLNEGVTRYKITGKVIQTPGAQYDKHYFFGDRVTIDLGSLTADCFISAVGIKRTPGSSDDDIAINLEATV